MPYEPKYELSTFDVLEDPWKQGILVHLVEALVCADRAYLRSNPHTPKLYESGVVYIFNRDRWQDVASCLKRGNGDCKDLSAWRIAELREAGELLARPRITMRVERRPEGPLTIYHVTVLRSNGLIEDPSALLGMRGPGY